MSHQENLYSKPGDVTHGHVHYWRRPVLDFQTVVVYIQELLLSHSLNGRQLQTGWTTRIWPISVFIAIVKRCMLIFNEMLLAVLEASASNLEALGGTRAISRLQKIGRCATSVAGDADIFQQMAKEINLIRIWQQRPRGVLFVWSACLLSTNAQI